MLDVTDDDCRRVTDQPTGGAGGSPCGSPPAPMGQAYAVSVIRLDARMVPWPEGVKAPFAVSCILVLPLRRLRPLEVKKTTAFARPDLWNTSATVATSVFWPFDTLNQEITRRPGDGATNVNL